ncbi:hypothetical protein [Fibrella forsythiae]|uniref:Uncharacterized protein n=1 Tax=Fibrella forsythiae TaxID=2817061 RepID=A0ABS3JS37_9BACT|nr:hypothetical protein [Fibrella forsythiae]MBO0952833.1 hypothetical protein [Fibrella forsythiae]
MAIEPMQKITATKACKQRMQQAKAKLPEGVGQLAVIRQVVQLKPELDRLTNLVRWKNAYSLHVADPELTELVEAAVETLTGEVDSTDALAPL